MIRLTHWLQEFCYISFTCIHRKQVHRSSSYFHDFYKTNICLGLFMPDCTVPRSSDQARGRFALLDCYLFLKYSCSPRGDWDACYKTMTVYCIPWSRLRGTWVCMPGQCCNNFDISSSRGFRLASGRNDRNNGNTTPFHFIHDIFMSSYGDGLL